jgi:hypothetical protein
LLGCEEVLPINKRPLFSNKEVLLSSKGVLLIRNPFLSFCKGFPPNWKDMLLTYFSCLTACL